MKLTRYDVLKDALDFARDTLHFYSASHSMTVPAQGCEEAWREAKEKCEILEVWLKELTN